MITGIMVQQIVLFETPASFHAVLVRHRDAEQYRVGQALGSRMQGLLSAGRGDDFVAFVIQAMLE